MTFLEFSPRNFPILTCAYFSDGLKLNHQLDIYVSFRVNSLSHCGIPRKPYGLLKKKQKNHPVGDSVQAVNLTWIQSWVFLSRWSWNNLFPKGHVFAHVFTHSLTIPKKVKLSFLKHLWNGICFSFFFRCIEKISLDRIAERNAWALVFF